MNYSTLSKGELRGRLDDNPPDTPDWKHAFAELQVRAVITQTSVSICLAVFSGVVALVAILQISGPRSTRSERTGVRVVEATQVVLRDENGQQQVQLSATKNGPRLEFSMPSGKVRAALELTPSLGSFVFYDTQGEELADLSVGSLDGTAHTSTLELFDGNRKTSARLDVNQFGPQLKLSDSAGYAATVGHTVLEGRSGETHDTSAASVLLSDKAGNVIWRAP